MALPPDAPDAKAEATVVVPMALQAFIAADDFGDTLYQVAPLLQPDLFKLQRLQRPDRYADQSGGDGGGDWDHHDLLGPVDTSWWRLQARYSPRFRDLTTGGPRQGRSGVYLSWCLPKVYRSAITATESAIRTPEDLKAFEERKLRSGYRVRDAEGAAIPEKHVQFRTAPDRWIVLRKVRSGGGGSEQGKETWKLIESNCLRATDDDELIAANTPDIEVITSPGIDPADFDPTNQETKETPKPMVMGRWAELNADNLASAKNRTYRSPFNAFEMGHEFFVDYQPHNMGVFSFFDDMQDCAGPVTADYAIIGFHSDARDDPLILDHPLPTDKPPLKNRDIMTALALVLDDRIANDPGEEAASTFLQANASKNGRTLTYGVLRNVRFDRNSVKHLHAPSIKLQEDVYSHQPIAVGLHTLDALAAYLHVALGGSSTAVQALLNQIIMLVARDDDVDSQRKAADEVAGHSWIAHKEGSLWQLPQKDDGNQEMPIITVEHRKVLAKLNNLQAQLDACEREEEQLIQRLYGCWWNALGLRKLPGNVLISRRERLKEEARAVGSRLDILSERKTALQLRIEKPTTRLENFLGGGTKLIKVPTRPFGRHQDPTILLAGAKSGWPSDFAKPLRVRLASEIAPLTAVAPSSSESWLDGVIPSVAAPLKPLLREFVEPDAAKRRDAAWRKSQYVDTEDMLDTQGWFPVFIEWEVEYYHVPFSKWVFEPSDEDTGRWRWVIPPETILAQDTAVAKDCRRIRGRTAFVPEAALTLRSRLEQLFAQTTDKDVLSWKDEVLNKVSSVEYFSATMSGFANHLLTLRLGHNHRPTVASCSNDAGIKDILGLESEILKKIEVAAPELAPYGASATAVSPPEYWVNNNTPFKPVTHGQARFTKLVVVDKFGQIVSGIRPTEYGDSGEGESSALYPCLSPSLICGALNREEAPKDLFWPNTAVIADQDPNVCQFFQLPPRINEHARLNVRFLMPGDGPRRSATEWDNPIWAWLVTNFQNHSIQLYDGDGMFVQEVVILDDATNPKVVFSMGPDSGGHAKPPTGRLVELLKSMQDFDFSYSMFDMLGGAADANWRSSSAQLDDMLPAAFGRPFCIADVGMSIELAAPALLDASLLSSPSLPSTEPASVLDYEFPIAMGNHTAAFDGLVGTFPSSGPIHVENISTAYSRYASRKANTPNKGYRSAEARPQPLFVKPYFVQGDIHDKSKDFAKAHDARLTHNSVSAIIDAKMPIHLYSGSLFPMVELYLPHWPIDKAVSNMQAFFAVGPTLVPEKPRTDLFHISAEQGGNVTASGGPTIQMPMAAEGYNAWRWMQPRLDGVDPEDSDSSDDDDHPAVAKTMWDPVQIKPLDQSLKVEAAAQSEVVEGYIMVQPRGRAE